MKKYKSLLLALTSSAAVVTPLATVIACSSATESFVPDVPAAEKQISDEIKIIRNWDEYKKLDTTSPPSATRILGAMSTRTSPNTTEIHQMTYTEFKNQFPTKAKELINKFQPVKMLKNIIAETQFVFDHMVNFDGKSENENPFTNSQINNLSKRIQNLIDKIKTKQLPIPDDISIEKTLPEILEKGEDIFKMVLNTANGSHAEQNQKESAPGDDFQAKLDGQDTTFIVAKALSTKNATTKSFFTALSEAFKKSAISLEENNASISFLLQPFMIDSPQNHLDEAANVRSSNSNPVRTIFMEEDTQNHLAFNPDLVRTIIDNTDVNQFITDEFKNNAPYASYDTRYGEYGGQFAIYKTAPGNTRDSYEFKDFAGLDSYKEVGGSLYFNEQVFNKLVNLDNMEVGSVIYSFLGDDDDHRHFGIYDKIYVESHWSDDAKKEAAWNKLQDQIKKDEENVIAERIVVTEGTDHSDINAIIDTKGIEVNGEKYIVSVTPKELTLKETGIFKTGYSLRMVLSQIFLKSLSGFLNDNDENN